MADDAFSPPWEQQVGDTLPARSPQLRERSVQRKLESVVTPRTAREPNSLAARLRKYNEGHDIHTLVGDSVLSVAAEVSSEARQTSPQGADGPACDPNLH